MKASDSNRFAIGKLCKAEVEISKGQTIGQVAKRLGITEQRDFRWRKEYRGLRIDTTRAQPNSYSPRMLSALRKGQESQEEICDEAI